MLSYLNARVVRSYTTMLARCPLICAIEGAWHGEHVWVRGLQLRKCQATSVLLLVAALGVLLSILRHADELGDGDCVNAAEGLYHILSQLLYLQL